MLVQSRNLKRITISLTRRFEHVPLFEPWLRSLRNLTVLEVAVSRNPLNFSPRGPFASCQQLTSVEDFTLTSRNQLPRSKGFHLMSDSLTCFSERNLLLTLSLFPNLQKLGLAHLLIKSELNNASSWKSFLV